MPDTIYYKADNDNIGTGYILDLYQDYVHIKGFDFLNQEYLEDFEWIIH